MQQVVDGIVTESLLQYKNSLKKDEPLSPGKTAFLNQNPHANLKLDCVKRCLRNRQVAWLTFFKLPELGNFANAIDGVKLTSDPDSAIVRTLLYLLSMETWLMSVITKASAERDTSKVDSLGVLAYLLKELLWNC